MNQPEPPWEQLFNRAEAVIERTIQSLPAPIQKEARRLPTLLEKWPAEGDAPDMLGLFHGFEPDTLSESNGPIFIFVGTVHELCEEEQLDFEEEVRITYLHELGHHLGWDEEDLEERGLG